MIHSGTSGKAMVTLERRILPSFLASMSRSALRDGDHQCNNKPPTPPTLLLSPLTATPTLPPLTPLPPPPPSSPSHHNHHHQSRVEHHHCQVGTISCPSQPRSAAWILPRFCQHGKQGWHCVGNQIHEVRSYDMAWNVHKGKILS